jgi:hypothetical protein
MDTTMMVAINPATHIQCSRSRPKMRFKTPLLASPLKSSSSK